MIKTKIEGVDHFYHQLLRNVCVTGLKWFKIRSEDIFGGFDEDWGKCSNYCNPCGVGFIDFWTSKLLHIFTKYWLKYDKLTYKYHKLWITLKNKTK